MKLVVDFLDIAVACSTCGRLSGKQTVVIKQVNRES